MNKDIKNIIDKALESGANIEIKMDGDKCDINIIQKKPDPITIPYKPNTWGNDYTLPWTYTCGGYTGDVINTTTTGISGYFRDATDEERGSTKAYINSISEPTGINWNDLLFI